ncbi:MAG: carbonic anhydrase [Deltaproteobacteria bacterium]|nr:carbonic anhydrase [Deltaproteobacteria bacterium]
MSPDSRALPAPAEEALRALLEGHARFLGGEQRPRPLPGGAAWRRAVETQAPVAVVLTCADARVEPAHLFNLDPGRVFVVRVAGPVVSPEVIGSVEFAVASLGVPLVMVLGHARCGAVAAAVARAREDLSDRAVRELASLSALVDQVSVAAADLEGEPTDLHASEVHNARAVAARLSHASSLLAEAQAAGRLGIVPAHLELDSGQVFRLD